MWKAGDEVTIRTGTGWTIGRDGVMARDDAPARVVGVVEAVGDDGRVLVRTSPWSGPEWCDADTLRQALRLGP